MSDAPPPPPPQYPVYQAAPPAPRQPSGFGPSLRQYWRGVTLLGRGYAEAAVDEAIAVEQRGGRKLFAWLIPVSITAVLVGFWFIAFVAAPIGIIKEQIAGSLGVFGSTINSYIDTGSMGGVLAGAFFVGIGFAAVFFVLRAGALVITARVRGGRVSFTDALIVVATSHSLMAFAWVLGTVLLAIPGMAGIILFGIVEVFVGLPLLLLAENAMYLGVNRLTGFTKPPLFVHAVLGGLASAVAYAAAVFAGYGLMMAAMEAVSGSVFS